MKKWITAATGAASMWMLGLAAAAESGTDPDRALAAADIGRFVGYFLMVMGVIFVALLLTDWIGKKWNNHKK